MLLFNGFSESDIVRISVPLVLSPLALLVWLKSPWTGSTLMVALTVAEWLGETLLIKRDCARHPCRMMPLPVGWYALDSRIVYWLIIASVCLSLASWLKRPSAASDRAFGRTLR